MSRRKGSRRECQNFIVDLSEQKRQTCEEFVNKLKGSSQKVKRANILLKATAWHNEINATQRGVDWQMKIDDARLKLQSIYPEIKL